MSDPLARSFPSTGDTLTWTAVFSGPLAWFASQQASYALVPWACHGGTLVAIHLVNVAALLLVAVGGCDGMAGVAPDRPPRLWARLPRLWTASAFSRLWLCRCAVCSPA
jgi:hypothetical protein